MNVPAAIEKANRRNKKAVSLVEIKKDIIFLPIY